MTGFPRKRVERQGRGGVVVERELEFVERKTWKR